MRWLYCEFADAGRAPMSCMFMCEDDAVGHSRSGMAKLAAMVGWSCTYDEFPLHAIQPDGKPITRDSVLVTTWFEPDRYVLHPETNEPVTPPVCFTAICRAAFEGDVINAFDRLFRSRGWVGETSAVRLVA